MRRPATGLLFQIFMAGIGFADEPGREGAASPFTRAANREFRGLAYDQEGTWRAPFFFMQMADTQYGMFTGNEGFEQEAALVAKAVGHVNRLQPRFVIVCGDLTNATPGHGRYAAQVEQFKRDFSQIDAEIPLVCVCGNHDIGNRPNAASIASYTQNFGDDYFGFWVGGVRGLVLNSTVIKDSTDAADVHEQQDAWFHEQLAAARETGAAHILVFQHHPWFLQTPDEADQYFNLPRERRKAAIAVMQEAGVRAVFAGHYHRNSYGNAGDIEMITTGPMGRPLGNDPSGFRIVEVYADRIQHAYYGMDDVPAEVSLASKMNGDARRSDVETFAGLDLEMVWIPGGTFQMGSRLKTEDVARRYGGTAEAFTSEHPRHTVTLDGFWMGKCEVTNAQFRRFKPEHVSGAHEGFTLDDDAQPVVHVTWEEAAAFCEWLSEGTGRRYHLPSEAQWEYACRGGSESVRYWGDADADIGRFANVLDRSAESVFGPALRGRKDNVTGRDPFIATSDGFQVAAPVGSFKPNAFGLYDTIGNAIEYCLDWHDPEYYQRSPANNPVNLTPTDSRVTRGGSWLHPSFRQRAALRGKVHMSHKSARVGFRVCRIPSSVDDAEEGSP